MVELVRRNHGEAVARRKLGPLPEGWQVSGLECIGDDAVIYRGGVAREFKSGPRKGCRTWDNPRTHECVVTESEVNAERGRFEAETGQCHACVDGQEWAGWSSLDGDHFKTCQRCAGTGKAP